MAISPLNVAREELRQAATGDDKYFRRMLMFFEMTVPSEHALGGVIDEFLFPIVIPPESYTLEEPFTVEATPTQGGGLYVEENGIVQRMIKIRGTTGYKPRPFKGEAWILDTIKPDKRSWTRELDWLVLDQLTGHGHIKYLQDCVFRSYADLKRDPTSAEDTILKFHIPKDDEHWLVVPQRFAIERSKERSTLYSYSIDLLVVDKADAEDADFSEDKGLLDTIKDAIRQVKTAIEMVQGAINDITALVAEIEGLVKNIATIIDSVGNVLGALSDFVEGVTDLIQSPLAVVDSIVGLVDEAKGVMDTLEQSAEDIRKLPENIKQKFDQINDGMERVASHPESFESSTRRKARENAKRLDLFQQALQSEIEAALAANPPSTLDAAENIGTGLTRGDVQSAKGELFTRKTPRNYKSAKQVSVTQGDSLASLAGQYLGDSRRWEEIAIINGLKPPFLDEQASADLVVGDEPVLPNVLGVGDKILIPSLQKGPVDQPLLPVLGARLDEPLESQLLGTDFKLELIVDASRPGKPLYDIPIDVEGGSNDAKTVTGVENLGQGLTNRLLTEKGQDMLYKRMGLRRIVGTNLATLDLETARFRIAQCLGQDGRVGNVRRIVFEGLERGTTAPSGTGLDTLVVDAVLGVRGFSEGQRVRLAV